MSDNPELRKRFKQVIPHNEPSDIYTLLAKSASKKDDGEGTPPGLFGQFFSSAKNTKIAEKIA